MNLQKSIFCDKFSGLPGAAGDIGLPGLNGADGVPGTPGIRGPKGEVGLDGKISIFLGLRFLQYYRQE